MDDETKPKSEWIRVTGLDINGEDPRKFIFRKDDVLCVKDPYANCPPSVKAIILLKSIPGEMYITQPLKWVEYQLI